jgi:hypothetical protein
VCVGGGGGGKVSVIFEMGRYWELYGMATDWPVLWL